ncbi:MAG: c-type cytochrome [Solirubrobacterales bacterium]
MNKRVFISFGLVALLLVIVIPLWAFNRDGSEASSPEKVAASDEAARQLFATNCGTCHTLDRAGTDGIVGPNLDDRLASAGPAVDSAAVDATQQRVMTAIQQGVGNGAMPAGILEGSNAETVSNFVARVAGQ